MKPKRDTNGEAGQLKRNSRQGKYLLGKENPKRKENKWIKGSHEAGSSTT